MNDRRAGTARWRRPARPGHQPAQGADDGRGLGGSGRGHCRRGALSWSHPRGPAVWYQPVRNGAPPVVGVHLQFGKNAGTEVVVSWHTTDAVAQSARHAGHADVRLRPNGAGRNPDVPRREVQHRGSRQPRSADQSHPDSDYVYAAVHDGADPELGAVRTAPLGRKPLHFTSFGDQSTPTVHTAARRKPRHRQHRVARSRRYHCGDRAHRPALQPGQRRPLLRQPRARPDPHLVGLVR